VRRLQTRLAGSGPDLAVEVTTAGLTRIDIYLDGRPIGSVDVEDGEIAIPVDASADTLELVGYDGEVRAAARKLMV